MATTSTIHLDEPIAPNIVDVSAPLVVKLTSDEPLPPPTLVVSHPQPLVTGITNVVFLFSCERCRCFLSAANASIPAVPPIVPISFSFPDPLEMFRPSTMPNVVLGDLDWLNIESEENIRPRKRQNIITISRKSFVLSLRIRSPHLFIFQATWKVYPPSSSKTSAAARELITEATMRYWNEQNFDANYSIINEVRHSISIASADHFHVFFFSTRRTSTHRFAVDHDEQFETFVFSAVR